MLWVPGKNHKDLECSANLLLSSGKGPAEQDRPKRLEFPDTGMAACFQVDWALVPASGPPCAFFLVQVLLQQGSESRPVRRSRSNIKVQPMTRDPEAALTFK